MRLNDSHAEWWVNGEVVTYLALDNGALLKELGDHLVVLGSAKLGFELALGSAVEHALVALPVKGGLLVMAVTLSGLPFLSFWQ